jgi:hypothetical protein
MTAVSVTRYKNIKLMRLCECTFFYIYYFLRKINYANKNGQKQSIGSWQMEPYFSYKRFSKKKMRKRVAGYNAKKS